MNSNLPRLIFSKRLGMLVAVAETVMSQGKGSGASGAGGASGASDALGQGSAGLSAASEALTSVGNNDPGKQSAAVALRSFCVALTLAFATQDIANAGQPVSVLPSGATVAAGSATISTPTTNSMIINQSSQNAILNWQSFGIGAGASVQFVQPNANAATLNRVLGSSATVIDGSLSANGRVLIVNPNGVVFGRGSYVDVGGLLATTKSISDTNFLAGNYQFIGGGTTGRVLNYGNIKADNGYVVLLSDSVANAGTIQANGGRVILGAGDSATLALSNGQVVNIVIDKPSAKALVDNSGTIKADGGVALLSARGSSDVLDSVLNVSGLVSAKGGVVNIDGGSNGAVMLANASVDVSATTGIGGNAIVQGQYIGIVNATNINASGASGGGHVVVGGDTLGVLPKQNISYHGKHNIKRSINTLLRRKIQHDWKIRDVNTPLRASAAGEKPVMLVVVEWFSANHSVYRVLSKAIRKMRDQFYLIGMGAMNTTDDAGREVFNEFIELDFSGGIQSFLKQVHNTARTRAAQILYMPSVGMFQTTMYLANLRVAPIQITTLGHSASTFAAQMDYFAIDEDFVGDEACFSEKVLALPNDAFPFIPSVGAPEELAQAPLRANPDIVQIAMAATIMKLNPEFLQTCRLIADNSPTPIHFQFFIGQAQGLMWPQVEHVVRRYLGDFATVNQHQNYATYLERLAQCDLYINPFPFGNMNGIVDMVSVGLIGICKSGREPHEHIDEGLFTRLNMPSWLVTRSNEEYIAAALRLINNHQERLAIRTEFNAHQALQRLFTGREELFGLAVEQLYHDQLAKAALHVAIA